MTSATKKPGAEPDILETIASAELPDLPTMESVGQYFGGGENPQEDYQPEHDKAPELLRHEHLLFQLRDLLTQHATRQRSTGDVWPAAERIVSQLDALEKHLPHEQIDVHGVHIRERQQLEERFRALRDDAKYNEIPSSLRTGPVKLPGDEQPVRRGPPEVTMHGWRGEDNETMNTLTCGVWNCARMDAERDMFPKVRDFMSRINNGDTYSSKRVPAPRPYCP